MRSNFSEHVQLGETLLPLTDPVVKFAGRRRCRGCRFELVFSEQGSSSSPALCFSLLHQLLTPCGLNPLSTPVKMPTPTRSIPPLSSFPFLFLLLTPISHRLKQPLSPRRPLFLCSDFVLLPFHDLFFVCLPFLPSHLLCKSVSESVSQSSSRLGPSKRLRAKQLSLRRLIQRDCCCFFLLSPWLKCGMATSHW